MKETLTVEIDQSCRVTIDPWNDGKLDMGITTKMDNREWVTQAGVVMTPAAARMLAIALLNRSGNAACLVKKFQWKEG